MIQFYLLWSLFAIFYHNFYLVESCTSFYCINSCGFSNSTKGYKLILANNRDENIYRLTQSANVWLPRINTWRLKDKSIDDYDKCDQSGLSPPFNLCAYGALDLAIGKPPNFYSTWLGMNEKGTVGNLLFYMAKTNYKEKYSRGIIVSDAIQNSSWPNTDAYMEYLFETRYNFNPFNYIQLEMSQQTGKYSIYYMNNVENKTHVKLNPNESETFFFSISNSNLEHPFQKVTKGEELFKNIINDYESDQNKDDLVFSLINLLQNTTDNYPDENLSLFMNRTDPKYEKVVRAVSRVKADYSTYWPNAQTRTSTLILIDHDDNVEYYEYNLTDWSKQHPTKSNLHKWLMTKLSFRLKPLYKKNIGLTNKNHKSILFGLISMSMLFYL